MAVSTRNQVYLRQRYLALLGSIGNIIAVVGSLHLVPLALLPFYPSETNFAGAFLLAGLPLLVIGLLSRYFLAPPKPISVTLQEGFVAVIVIWVSAILFGSIPFFLISDLSFTQAIFESTSGWTTTGLSVVDVTAAPKLLLFFRSFIQLAGGAGLAIIALSAITGPIGTRLAMAEGRSDQLAPHVRESILIVLRIYFAYIIFGIFGLRLAGMSWFDAVNHTFTAVSTGGFSTRTESIGYWDSPTIEAVTIVLMFMGTTNFLVAYTFMRGKWRVALRSGELRLMATVLPVVSILLFSLVTLGLYPTTSKAMRVAIFETVSALSTTGFATVGYNDWTDFGWFMLIVLMLMGGGSGSTAGAIKQFRIYVLFKAIRWEIRRAFLPSQTVNEPAIWYGDRRQLLSSGLVRQVSMFIGLYSSIFLFGSGVMMAFGFSMQESLFEFASTLGTVGLSVGVTSPDLTAPVMWVQIFGMVLGRLEFFAVIIGILKIFRDVTTIIGPIKINKSESNEV